MHLQLEYACVCLTSECNLQCKFCYRLSSRNQYLDESKFEIILLKLKEMGFHTLNITGGEPLLHPEFEKIVEIANKLRFFVVLSSNAILLNMDDPIYEKVNLITIPLDGSNLIINAAVRGENHFDYVWDIIEKYKIKKYPFKLKINTVMTSHNYHDMLDIAQKLKDKGIFWRVFYCKNNGEYNEIDENEMITSDVFKEKINEIDEKYPKLLMAETCKRDVNDDLAYSFVTADGDFVISQGGKEEKIGSLLTLTSEDIMSIIIKRGYEVVEHKGKKYQ